MTLAGLDFLPLLPEVQRLQAFAPMPSIRYAFVFTSKNISIWPSQDFGDKDRRDRSLKSVYLKRKGGVGGEGKKCFRICASCYFITLTMATI